jgi:hypothetical protein
VTVTQPALEVKVDCSKQSSASFENPLEPAVLDYGAEPGFAKELASLVNIANTKECPILGCEIKDAGCVTNTGDAN